MNSVIKVFALAVVLAASSVLAVDPVYKSFVTLTGKNQAGNGMVHHNGNLIVPLYGAPSIAVIPTNADGTFGTPSYQAITGIGATVYNFWGGVKIGEYGYWGMDVEGKYLKMKLTSPFTQTLWTNTTGEYLDNCFDWNSNIVCASYLNSASNVPNIYYINANTMANIWVRFFQTVQTLACARHGNYGYFASSTKIGKYDLQNQANLGQFDSSSDISSIHTLIVHSDTLFASGDSAAGDQEFILPYYTLGSTGSGNIFSAKTGQVAWGAATTAGKLQGVNELGGFLFYSEADAANAGGALHKVNPTTKAVVTPAAGIVPTENTVNNLRGLARTAVYGYSCSHNSPAVCASWDLNMPTTTTTTVAPNSGAVAVAASVVVAVISFILALMM